MLSQRFAHEVSAVTLRPDLDHLADQQLLNRTHGGAGLNTTSYDLPMRHQTTTRAEAAVNRGMVTQAKHTVVVTDSTKLGRVGFSGSATCPSSTNC
ncbi:MAG: DeoR/GlpR transcriptional regulator [Friedmanniella sp.]|nr:DeoR/GlpR transcriptional regulator [Friedmanniella sp.]